MADAVYFRDSEECLRYLSRCAASKAEVRDWFTRMGLQWSRSEPAS
jgi:hypothetical protein